MSVDMRRFLIAAVSAAGVACALSVAPTASADPPPPGPPPMPPPTPAAAAPPTGPEMVVDASGPTAPPNGVPHLASPDALPPGSTMDPTQNPNDRPNVSYLKDLWHAVQGQEISGKEALILGLAQRGMNTPYPQGASGPNVPIAPEGAPPVQPPAPVAPAPVPLSAPAPVPLSAPAPVVTPPLPTP